MKERNYLFIVNPAAGHARVNNAFDLINEAVRDKKLVCEFKITQAPGQAAEFAREAVECGFSHIVSVGGDGTTHEVAQGMVGSSSTLCVIPSGSGNDFPKAASIPLDAHSAIEVLFSGRERMVDAGRMGERYFINGLGIGLDGAVSHRFKKLKLFRGQFGYLIGSVQEALGFKGFGARIKIGAWTYEGTLLLTGASNGLFQGGKFKLAPEAVIDDGILDFHIIKDMSVINRLIKIPRVLEGSHSALDEVEIKRSTDMEITLEERIPAHMDGEPFYVESGTHRIEIIPSALRILSS